MGGLCQPISIMHPLSLLIVELDTAKRRLRNVFEAPDGTPTRRKPCSCIDRARRGYDPAGTRHESAVRSNPLLRQVARGEHWRQSQAAREPFCPRLAPGDNQSRLLPSARLISNRNNRLSPRGDQVDRVNGNAVL